MQFYVISEDPQENAKLLPDYALKRVNIREGWQMLSDIGHKFGVTWPGQNKPYNLNHPSTRRWYMNKNSFKRFTEYYFYCLLEYNSRFERRTIWHQNWFNARSNIDELSVRIPDCDEYQFMIRYLLESKANKLSDNEIDRLEAELL